MWKSPGQSREVDGTDWSTDSFLVKRKRAENSKILRALKHLNRLGERDFIAFFQSHDGLFPI